MDPKTLSNLDPKLRETYERVMGGSDTPTAATTTTTTTTTVAPPPPADGAPQAPVIATEPPIPTPSATSSIDPTLSAPVAPTAPTFMPTQTPVMPMNEPTPLPSPASVNQAADSGSASPLVRVLYIAGAIVFFIVYTYFWLRVFNLQMPF